MEFSKIERNYDLEELGEDELRNLVREYREAEDENMAEFDSAVDRIDELEEKAEEADEFHEKLADKLTAVSPLTESDVSEYSLARKHELIQKFSESGADEADEGQKEQSEEDFNDTGKRGETETESDEPPEFVKEALDGVSGVQP